MNRRHFLALGSAATFSLTRLDPALASPQTTALYAKGLILVSFEDTRYLRLGFPKAPGHKATLAMLPQSGTRRMLNLKGNSFVETTADSSGRTDYKIPELIRMQEIYGSSLKSKIAACPTVIHIPYAAIRNIKTSEVSPSRYTFVRADNGKEITTFRPRQVAETLRIDLVSDGILKLDGGKTAIPLDAMSELHTEHSPDAPPPSQSEVDPFTAHFHHYFAYLERPAASNFDVIPRKLSGTSSVTPRVGNRYMMFWPYYYCFVVSV